MSKKEEKKKLTHIDIKDNGLIAASKVGTKLANIKASIETRLIRGLIKGSNETSLARYKIMQNINMRNFNLEVGKLINQTSKAVKTALKEDKTVNLKPNQVASISSTINKGLVLLQNSASQTYQRTLNDLFLKVKSADSLKDQLQKHINSGLNLGVVYQNGREYQFDTYFEMKARTDIQVDIKDNLVDSGREAGVIFYITSYYGDCAKDHAEWQGKIYVDDQWESIAPKDRLDEIGSYIKANDIKTVKYITDGDVKLTTRPNCRHYFMPIGIDEVLGAKTEKDVNKLREERNLNFNGKYKPEKYEALQKQRLNERKIRAEKEKISKNETLLALNPSDKEFEFQIKISESKVKMYQKEQVKLVKEYDNLQRNYAREQPILRANLTSETIKKPIKFTDKDNDVYIYRKKLGLSQKSFNEISKLSHQELTKADLDDKIEIEKMSDPRLLYENILVRDEYHKELEKLRSAVDANKSSNMTLEEQAMFAFGQRNIIRTNERKNMVDLKALDYLGLNHPTKTFDELLKDKMETKKLSREEALEDIIKTCTKSNPKIDKLFRWR